MFFFLMKRRPPRSTLDRSSAASDVYKRQALSRDATPMSQIQVTDGKVVLVRGKDRLEIPAEHVSYTHLRAHATVLDLVCRILLEKKNYYNL